MTAEPCSTATPVIRFTTNFVRAGEQMPVRTAPVQNGSVQNGPTSRLKRPHNKKVWAKTAPNRKFNVVLLNFPSILMILLIYLHDNTK